MKKVLVMLLALAFMLLFAGCNTYATFEFTCSRGKAIPQDAKEEVDAAQQQLLTAISAGDAAQLQQLLSPEYVQHTNAAALLMRLKYIAAAQPVEVDEYHMKFRRPDGEGRWVSASMNADYWLYVEPTHNRMYMKLTTFSSDSQEYILISTYALEGESWIITDLAVDEYTFAGKAAPELYEQAMQLSQNGYVVPAALFAQYASRCLRPCGTLYYEKNDEMTGSINSILQQAQAAYNFPVPLSTVSGSFDVLEISSMMTHQGIVPVVSYLTASSLEDADTLTAEAEAIKAALGSAFTGMDMFSWVYVRAYNQAPTQSETDHPSHITLV